MIDKEFEYKYYNKLKMIEGRPRESLVQYENPIEVRLTDLTLITDISWLGSQ